MNTYMKFPKIGDHLMRVATTTRFGETDDVPRPCVVVYVNEPHQYYTVEFIKTNIRESYKIPDIDEIRMFKRDFERVFGYEPKGVYVYESGKIYPSVSACAVALGVKPCTISKHIHGHSSHVKGYHIYML